MIDPSDAVMVMVTAPDLETARSLAHKALEARLTACANIVPAVESHYWWQGKLEHSAEVLMLLKSSRQHLASLEELITSLHPYDTPEIVAIAPCSTTERYLSWWKENLGPA